MPSPDNKQVTKEAYVAIPSMDAPLISETLEDRI